jgi:hypothetical protein
MILEGFWHLQNDSGGVLEPSEFFQLACRASGSGLSRSTLEGFWLAKRRLTCLLAWYKLASQLTCSTSWELYQASKQDDLHVGLIQLPFGKPVELLAELVTGMVQVPAWQVGSTACWDGTGTSLARRMTCLPSWYLYKAGEPVDLLIMWVRLPSHGGVVTPLLVIEVYNTPQ